MQGGKEMRKQKTLFFVLCILFFFVSVTFSVAFLANAEVMKAITVTNIKYENGRKNISNKDYIVGEKISTDGIKATIDYAYMKQDYTGDTEEKVEASGAYVCDPPVVTLDYIDQNSNGKGKNNVSPAGDGTYKVEVTINFDISYLKVKLENDGVVSNVCNISPEVPEEDISFKQTINVKNIEANDSVVVRVYQNYIMSTNDTENDTKYEPYDVIYSGGSQGAKLPEKISPYFRKGYEFAGVAADRDGTATELYYDEKGELSEEAAKVALDQSIDLYAIWKEKSNISDILGETVYQYDGNAHTIDTSEISLHGGQSIVYSQDGETWTDEPPAYVQIGTYTINYKITDGNNVSVLEGTTKLTINGPSKNMMPGISGLQGFRQGESNYDYIWFGNHVYGNGTSSVSPIKFRVLDTKASDTYNKSGLFLYSEYILENLTYEDNKRDYISYNTSSLRSKIANFSDGSNTYIFDNSFDIKEKNAIISTTNGYNIFPTSDIFLYKHRHGEFNNASKQARMTTTVINGDKLFLLPAAVLADATYFPQSPINAIDKTQGSSTSYWTSTVVQGVKDLAAFYSYDAKEGVASVKNLYEVDNNGGVNPVKNGLRIATNIKTDDVAFISSTAVKNLDNTIENGIKSKADDEGKLCRVSDDKLDIYNSFKLTLFDKETLSLTDTLSDRENLVFDKQGISDITISGLSYKINKEKLDGNEYISTIITDKESGEIEFYGRLKNLTSESAQELDAIMTLSHLKKDEIEAGEYEIKLFVECYNGGKGDENKTDYISNYVTIPLTIYDRIDYQLGSTVVTYDGTKHTIDDPQIENINRWYVDVLYLHDGETDDKWTKEKPTYSEVKRANSDDAESEVIPYVIKCKVSVKDEYEKWNEFKYYKENIQEIHLTIYPATPSYSVSGDGGRIEKDYDGQNLIINISKNILNAENATVTYSEDGENYSERYPQLVNVKDTLNGAEPQYDANGNINNIGKQIFFKIEHPNYETYDGSIIAAIKPVQMQISSESVITTYDRSEHSINVINYAPHPNEVNIQYYDEDPQNNKLASPLSEKPSYINAGNYTTYYEISEKDNKYNYYPKVGSANVIINEAAVSYQSNGFTGDYDREKHTISLYLYDPVVSSAKVEYIVKDSEPSEEEWNTQSLSEKPEFTEAGIYNVWFKISSKNYKPFIKSEKVTIHKAPILCSEAENIDVIYDGMEHGATVQPTQPTADKATVLYSNDGGITYTLKDSPKYKNAGSYEIFYKIIADNNYEEYKGSKVVNISKRTIKRAVVETISRRAYTGLPITPSIIIQDGTPSILSEDDYEVIYKNNVEKGEAKAIIKGKNNYDDQMEETFYIVDANEQISDDVASHNYTDAANSSSNNNISDSNDILGSNENASGGIVGLTSALGSAYSMSTGQNFNAVILLSVILLVSVAIILVIIRTKAKK